MASVEKRIFLRWTSLERTEGSAHNSNIEQQNGGVKKEQVKGCGSVNRPTADSQRPAEPAATGFSQGVKISKNRGRFEGLGVKLWVIDARFPQCRAIPYGVAIGVAKFSRLRQGQAERLAVQPGAKCGAKPRPPQKHFFSSALRRVSHLKNCAAINKEKGREKTPCPR